MKLIFLLQFLHRLEKVFQASNCVNNAKKKDKKLDSINCWINSLCPLWYIFTAILFCGDVVVPPQNSLEFLLPEWNTDYTERFAFHTIQFIYANDCWQFMAIGTPVLKAPDALWKDPVCLLLTHLNTSLLTSSCSSSSPGPHCTHTLNYLWCFRLIRALSRAVLLLLKHLFTICLELSKWPCYLSKQRVTFCKANFSKLWSGQIIK